MRTSSDDKFSPDEFGVEGPAWADGKIINEAIFCEEFLSKHKILFSGGSFFTTEGRVVDEIPLKRMVFDDLKICAVANVPQKISNIVELLKIQALDETFAPETDRIHLQNGTLYIDGTFDESKSEIVRSRLPISYNPNAPVPKLWLSFLGELLYPEDIPTLQEFIGYCLIPSNKGQRMMVIKGNGGEGKSQIGAVMTTLFGSNMKDGSIGKISENRFARADLEHILLCIDDDLRMEGLKHTNYVKSIVTAQGKMDLEKKNKQSYQGYMFIGAVRKFLDMETITAPLIHELIDHIDVYEAEGKGKNKTQRVVIHYNFVGYLEIPESDTPCFTADTRQGVAIGYIAKPTEKSA